MRIATRIRWLVLGVVVVTATAIGVVLFWGYARIVERQQRDSIARRVHLESERIGAAFEEIRHDVTLLSNLSLATRLLVDRDDEAGRTRLGEFFVDMLEAKPNYAQVRLISGDDGREIVRADRDPTTGAVRIAPRDALQDKADEPYHRAAVARPPGTTFLAETTLNREHGTITMPLQPMMRATITIGDETGRSRGYVIINIDFRRFVAVLMPERKDDILLLANADGDYLVHPDETRTFGFDRGRRHRLTDDFAGVEALLGETPAKTSVRTRDAAGRFAHFQRIDGQVDVRDQTLIFGIVGSEAAVADRAAVVAWRALGITAILLLAALCVASWLAHRLVRPLHDLTSAADALVETPDAVALPALDRADEIGVLARAFRNMIDRLGERERRLRAAGARIDRANRDLDHFARIAAHDLREPARRIAGMVDAVAGRESERLTPAGAALLVRMNHEAMRMIAHVDQFRALARIGGEDDLVRSSVDLGNLVKMIVDERKDELAAREISVRMHMLPTIDAYEHLVIVLYRNLLDNGIIHSTGEDRIIEFTAESTAGGWILGVRNSGSVIPEPDLERIFEPFTTLHQRADRAGFGLAIARRIVERHAGWIRAASGPDTVHVRFMLNVENEAHDEDDQPPDDRNDPARRHGGR